VTRAVAAVRYIDEVMRPAIVEGALQQAIANTRVTIHGSPVAVVGHGTIA